MNESRDLCLGAQLQLTLNLQGEKKVVNGCQLI